MVVRQSNGDIRRHSDISSWLQRRDPGWIYKLGVTCMLKAFKAMRLDAVVRENSYRKEDKH